MARNNFQEPPDPENSPIEKLIVQRRFKQERRVRDYLQAQGIDTDLAERLGAALDRWNEDSKFEWQEEIRELEGWANIHTHGGTAGTGVISPHTYPPFRMVKGSGTGNFAAISLDHGQTWTDNSSNDGWQYFGPRMEYVEGDGGFVIRPVSYRYNLDIWNDSASHLGIAVQVEASSSNNDNCTSIATDGGSLAVVVGGRAGTSGEGRVWFSSGPTYDTTADWTPVVLGPNELSDVCYVPETDNFVTVGRADLAYLYRSTPGDPSDWEQLSTSLPFACNRIQSFDGNLFAGEENGNRLVKSEDGGTTWSTVLTLTAGESFDRLYSNGPIFMLPTSEGLYRSTDGDTFTLVTPPAASTSNDILAATWDGTTWLVLNNAGEIWLTEDSSGESDWSIVYTNANAEHLI